MKLKLLLLVTRGLALLPFSWLMALGGFLGGLLPVGGRREYVAHRNLSACFPAKSATELRAHSRAHCREYIKMGIEAPLLWHWPLERIYGLVTEVCGQQHLDHALAKGRGLIFAAPHCGSWELLSLYMARHTDFAAIYKPSDKPALDRLIIRARERSGGRMFAADSAGLRHAYKHLKAGKVLGILPDQQPRVGEGQYAPFFGVRALTMTLLSKMVQRSGCEVIFSTCERLNGGGGYRVHYINADPNIYNPDISESLAAMNRGVEACAKISLAQYLWSYRRFSIQPAGEPDFYARRE